MLKVISCRNETGPIALIDEQMPWLLLKAGHYDKIVSIQEIKSRSGRIIAVVTKGDTQVRELADYVRNPETRCVVSIDYNNTITTFIIPYSGNENVMWISQKIWRNQ
jgi:glucosamine 6-phosphate synthetase-like amidotransferase/phosphosugar isomerase protein